MKRRYSVRAGTLSLLLMTALSAAAPSAEAGCGMFGNYGVERLQITPATQSAPVGNQVSIVVSALGCEGEVINNATVRAVVVGANLYQAQGVTPFEFTYQGSAAGRDEVSFAYLGLEWGLNPIETQSVSAVVEWIPTEASIEANGAVVTVTKSSGNPQGGLATFECDARAAGATKTRIASCIAGSTAAPSITADGPVASTAGAFTTSNPSAIEICWTAEALFATGWITKAGCDLS